MYVRHGACVCAAATILFGVDSRVSSVKRALKLKQNDKVLVWYSDFSGATEYTLNGKTGTDHVRPGSWILKGKAGGKRKGKVAGKGEDNTLEPANMKN